MEAKQKRERSINFSTNEVRILVKIVLKYVEVLESKQTDAVTWKEKQAIWTRVAEEFNTMSGVTHRTAKVLRLKYDVLKRNLKRKSSRNKQEIFKTGGGIAEVETFFDYEEQLIEVMGVTVDGLPSQNDSDNVLSVSGSFQLNNEVEMVENNFSAHEVVLEEILIEIEDHESDFNNVGTLENGNEQLGEIQENSESTNLLQENKMPYIKWNPNILKQEKSKVLKTKKQRNKELNVKLDTLTTSRNELIKLQISVAEHELQLCQTKMEQERQKGEKEIENLQLQKNSILSHEQRQVEQHALKMELLRLEIEEKKLNNLILKRSLS